MTLKEKILDLYTQLYGTSGEPTAFDIAKMVNVLLNAEECCPTGAHKEIGQDVWDLLHKHSNLESDGFNIRITELLEEIGWYDIEDAKDEKVEDESVGIAENERKAIIRASKIAFCNALCSKSAVECSKPCASYKAFEKAISKLDYND